MKKQQINSDDEVWVAKRERQARSRKLVQDGLRTQESMFFFSPELVKTMKVKHRKSD